MRKPNGYWKNKIRCFEEAQKYKNRTRWALGHQTSYQAARRYGWLEFCSKGLKHDVDPNRKPRGYWTKENVHKEAKKYLKLSHWEDNSSGSYNRACTMGWLEDVTSHMEKPNKIKKEICFSHARGCKSKGEFRENNKTFYSKALNKGWYDTLCELNGWEYTPHVPWTKHMILESTEGYTNIKDWVRNNHHRTKKMARQLGILNKCVKRIRKNAKVKHNNIIHNLIKSTKGYTEFDDWCAGQPQAYDASKRYMIKTQIKKTIKDNKRKFKKRGMKPINKVK
tara:strand:- start:32190 stop:33029 length:840 start_codon:yes stop_codon:yes gene_type:complete